jgi:homoserine dehydrogenase
MNSKKFSVLLTARQTTPHTDDRVWSELCGRSESAQEKGFAEADPTADVEGHDVANKLSILISLVFAPVWVRTKSRRRASQKSRKTILRSPISFGYKIKLLATERRLGISWNVRTASIRFRRVIPLRRSQRIQLRFRHW